MIKDLSQEAIGFNIEKTVKMMKLEFSRVLLKSTKIDVTVDQWVILNILNQKNTLSQQDIGKLTCKDAPTITKIIDLLVQKKYVTRHLDPKDRRKFLVKMTELGVETYIDAQPLVSEYRNKTYQSISYEELNILDQVMAKIFRNVTSEF